MTASVAALAVRLAIGAGAFLSASTPLAGVAAAQTAERGVATIVPVDGTGATAVHALSDPFRLALPDGAACPGDSADEGYRVQTFFVPATDDAAAIPYDGLGPTPPAAGHLDGFRQPLYDVDTRPVASVLTAEAEEPGGPGRIVGLPAFTFAVYGEGELPVGSFRAGVACTLANRTVRLWEAPLEIVAAEGGSLRWRAAAARSASASEPGTGTGAGTAVVAAAGAAVLATGLYARRRRTTSRPRAERAGVDA